MTQRWCFWFSCTNLASRIVCPNGSFQTSEAPLRARMLVEIDLDTTMHETNASVNRQILGQVALPTSPNSSHLPAPSLHNLLNVEQEVEHSAAPPPTTQKIHSPPPSPRLSLLLMEAQGAAIQDPYISADTPPASRRASSPDISDREHIHEDVAVNASTLNPFNVKVPYIKPPLFIDYGTNLHIGATTFINRNFTVLDSPILRVSIGEGCLIGPNTTLASITHPLGESCYSLVEIYSTLKVLTSSYRGAAAANRATNDGLGVYLANDASLTDQLDASERAGPLGSPSFASEISIGDDCWIGASVNILDGVKIGNGCVIGAGSVVTRVSPIHHLCYRDLPYPFSAFQCTSFMRSHVPPTSQCIPHLHPPMRILCCKA